MITVKQRSGEQWVLMQARRLGLGRNPLRRPTDRLETLLLWCTLVVALLLVPIGAAVSIGYRNTSDALAAQQRAGLAEVHARTMESTEGRVPAAPGDVLSRVRISYLDPQGIQRESMTSVVIGTKAGADATIWLDKSGSIVTAPRSTSDSAAIASGLGLLIIFGGWLVLWGLFRLARIPLDRHRFRSWDAEWDAVAPRWLRGQK